MNPLTGAFYHATGFSILTHSEMPLDKRASKIGKGVEEMWETTAADRLAGSCQFGPDKTGTDTQTYTYA